MSDAMKAALKVLQQVIIEEHPDVVQATVKYCNGNWVEFEIIERGGGKCEL